MFVSLVALIIALALSGVSAVYSILGLMAIFAAAPIPVMVMGSVLETAKIVVTLWLHTYWDKAPFRLKLYLVPAVCCLMILTSLGTFGYLSKAHNDQAVPSDDIQAQVTLFDEKIKTQRENIEAARRALTQMDSAVDQTMSRTTDEKGATNAAALRRAQGKERTRLQTDIDLAQQVITKLQEARAPIASNFRKVNAETGPIRYVAALVYGDKTDQNMLEAAVRWVIIIIVIVFDPLAIVLLLAATTSFDWIRDEKKKKRAEEVQHEQDIIAHDKMTSELIQEREAELANLVEESKSHVLQLAKTETELLKLTENANLTVMALDSAKIEISRLQAEQNEKNELIRANTENIVLLQTQVDDDLILKNEYEEELTKLHMQNDNAKISLSTISAALAELQETELHYRTQIAEQRARIAEYETEISNNTKFISDLETDIIQVQQQLAITLEQLHQHQHAEVEFKNTIALLNNDLEQVNTNNEQAISNNTVLTKELNDANQQLSSLTIELVQAKSNNEQTSLLSQQVTDLTQKLEVHQLTSQDIISALNAELITANSATNEAKLQLAEVEKNSEKIMQYVHNKEQSIMSELSSIVEHVDELMFSLNLKDEELSALLSKKESVMTELQFMIDEYNTLKDQKNAVEQTVDLLVKELHAANQQIDDLQADKTATINTVVEEDTDAAEVTSIVTVSAPVIPQLPLIPVRHEIAVPVIEPDSFPLGGDASFGTSFPTEPIKGDLCLRVDYLPSKLFKWSGTRWIEIKKSVTDSYVHDPAYIQLLVNKISTGEYDFDDLSPTEQQSLQEYLNQKDTNGPAQ